MRNSLRCSKSALMIPTFVFAGALLFLVVATGKTAEPPKVDLKNVPVSTTTEVIPMAEVASRAAEVVNILNTIQTKLTPDSHTQEIRKMLPKSSEQIRQQLLHTAKILQEQPSLAALQAQQKLWQGMQSHAAEWLTLLTSHSLELRQALNRLADLQKTWSQTREALQAANASESILNEINEVLKSIEAMQSSLELQLSDALDVQSGVAQQIANSETALAQVVQAQNMAMTGILTRDALPIWSPLLWAKTKIVLSANLQEIGNNCLEDIQRYLRDPSRGMPLHIAIFVVLSVLFSAAKRREQQWQATAEENKPTGTVFDRPYSAALLFTLFFATRATSNLPLTVQQLFVILQFIPMIRLTQPFLGARLQPWIYFLWLMFCLDNVRQIFTIVPLIGQVLLLLEAIAGMVLVGWSLFFGQLRLMRNETTSPFRIHFMVAGAGFMLLILTTGLLAGALGYMHLAYLLVPGIAVGATLALTIYVSFRVLCDTVAFILRVWPVRLLRMVQEHQELFEQRARRLLIWMAILGWVARFLDYVGLLEPFFSFIEALLSTKLQRGSISISINDVMAFFLTVWAAYLLSNFIRFLLREDVYPRLGVAEGVSYAISSLLNYVILALGVVMGLGLMGVDLSKVTVLAGAFGVGIGFGLQSVVNNFVCGLILLFERPIHVGDLVEIGGRLAEVRRIGIRASTVRTRQGSDIIVPNSQLVTDQVTNWTHGDRLRRIQLPVGVNYGADPNEVIKLLVHVAREHPRILAFPPARALFMEYGDSSLNFELRAWTDEFLNWRYIRSDLAIAAYDAIREAGMSFPFPQRDVHLLHETNVPPTISRSSDAHNEDPSESGDRKT